MKKKKNKKIYHTRRVYLSGDTVDNGVLKEDLKDHILYNLTYRPGCAFFVEGVCKDHGYLSAERCKEIEKELRRHPIKMSAHTVPYQ